MQVRVRFAGCARNPLRRSCVSSARNAGESAMCRVPAQPSAEIVRVECAKCRRECDLSGPRATLCGDRACRVREMQARVICRLRAQPSAEIVRVECAKCRRECDLPGARATLCGDRACRVREMQARVRFAGCPRNPLRRSRVECAKCRRECDSLGARATLCGDRACRVREMQARVRFGGCPRNPLRRSCASSARNAGESAICRVCAQPSAEIVRVECAKCRHWRLSSATSVRGAICGAGS